MTGARPSRGERGEALSAAILFLGVFFTVLVGIHVVIVAMARTAVQSAADAAVAAAAQGAGPGPRECDGDPDTTETARECEGILGARLAMVASDSSVVETRPPAVVVEPERGVGAVLVFGGTISPVLGGLELTAQACGPLDDVSGLELTGADVWQC